MVVPTTPPMPESEAEGIEERVDTIQETRHGNPYQIQKGLFGKLFNSIFSLLSKRYPNIEAQLKLTSDEEELIDDALRPLVSKLLSKFKILGEEFEVVIAIATITLPRVALIIEEESKLHGLKKKPNAPVPDTMELQRLN